MNKVCIALIVAGVLAGCGESAPVQTAEWYKAHDAERQGLIAKCKANPGELAASPNCINAQQAQNEKELSRRGFLKLPPVTPGKEER